MTGPTVVLIKQDRSTNALWQLTTGRQCTFGRLPACAIPQIHQIAKDVEKLLTRLHLIGQPVRHGRII